MTNLSIGEIADRTGISTSAIRYYESVGVLPRAKRVNGQRRYDTAVLNQISIVKMAQEAGFTVQEIKVLVSGFPDGTTAGERWQDLAQRKLPEVEAMIQRLTLVKDVLVESLGCDCLTLDACGQLGWQHESRNALQ